MCCRASSATSAPPAGSVHLATVDGGERPAGVARRGAQELRWTAWAVVHQSRRWARPAGECGRQHREDSPRRAGACFLPRHPNRAAELARPGSRYRCRRWTIRSERSRWYAPATCRSPRRWPPSPRGAARRGQPRGSTVGRRRRVRPVAGPARRKQHAAVVVSHDFSVIESLTDRTIVMHLGRVIERGLTDQLFMTRTSPTLSGSSRGRR